MEWPAGDAFRDQNAPVFVAQDARRDVKVIHRDTKLR
jgi:hypothetical protein